jgi:hypothetical protein
MRRLSQTLSGPVQHQPAGHNARDAPSLIPVLTALPLHRDAGRMPHLNPCRVRAGSIGRFDTPRHHSADLAGMRKGQRRRPPRCAYVVL